MNKMDKSGNNCAGGHLAATYARKETYLPLRFFTTLLVMMLTAVCVMGQGTVPNNISVGLLPGTLPDGITTVSGNPMTLSPKTDSDLFYMDGDNIFFKVAIHLLHLKVICLPGGSMVRLFTSLGNPYKCQVAVP